MDRKELRLRLRSLDLIVAALLGDVSHSHIVHTTSNIHGKRMGPPMPITSFSFQCSVSELYTQTYNRIHEYGAWGQPKKRIVLVVDSQYLFYHPGPLAPTVALV